MTRGKPGSVRLGDGGEKRHQSMTHASEVSAETRAGSESGRAAEELPFLRRHLLKHMWRL